VRHSMSDTQENCVNCDVLNSLTRVPQMPTIKTNTEQKKETGSLTKNYIEKNRELLHSMKEEARNQEHDV